MAESRFADAKSPPVTPMRAAGPFDECRRDLDLIPLLLAIHRSATLLPQRVFEFFELRPSACASPLAASRQRPLAVTGNAPPPSGRLLLQFTGQSLTIKCSGGSPPDSFRLGEFACDAHVEVEFAGDLAG
jgi:hypothetical protein